MEAKQLGICELCKEPVTTDDPYEMQTLSEGYLIWHWVCPKKDGEK